MYPSKNIFIISIKPYVIFSINITLFLLNILRWFYLSILKLLTLVNIYINKTVLEKIQYGFISFFEFLLKLVLYIFQTNIFNFIYISHPINLTKQIFQLNQDQIGFLNFWLFLQLPLGDPLLFYKAYHLT